MTESFLLEPPIPDTVPRITTLRDLFTHHLDVNAVPRRHFFGLLHHFSMDPTEREKLEEFARLDGQGSCYIFSYMTPFKLTSFTGGFI